MAARIRSLAAVPTRGPGCLLGAKSGSSSGVERTSLLAAPGPSTFRLPTAATFYTDAREPFHPIPGRMPKWQVSERAVEIIKSGDRVFIHSAAATPNVLIEAMCKYAKSNGLTDIECIHIHTEGPGMYNDKEYAGVFRSNSLFTGSNCRKAIADGRGDYTPIFLSEIPLLFRRNILNIDVALMSVSPPDKHGYCSLGCSVDISRAALQNAKTIIGLINPYMPRTFGESVCHITHFDIMVEGEQPLPKLTPHPLSEEEIAIGKHIANQLVDNGATLQMGIGSIPDAVLASLKQHKDLGIHTEMFSDGVVDLVELGTITNARKQIRPGKCVSSFIIGTEKVFKFINDNPFVALLDIQYVNDVAVISENPKVCAINSCIEIDLTGQVVSDSIGTRIYSGFGGQIDFIRGASLAKDGLGKPIIALCSTTKKGETKITPYLKTGSGVVTTRAHVHYVVTEYGIAYLFGKNLRQRAYELINVAHPSHRESLEKAAYERLKCMPSP